MLIVTSNGVPGHRVEAVLGTVIGTSIRSTDLGGALRGLGGGDREEIARTSRSSRNEAIENVWRECQARGANAVVALKFDTAEIGTNASEVCAYGTAVVVVALPEGEPGATPQSAAIANNPPAMNWPRMDDQKPVNPRPQPGGAPADDQPTPGVPTEHSPNSAPALQPPFPVSPSARGDNPGHGPSWQPTADAPTTDFPAVGQPEDTQQKKSWLDLS